MKKTDIPNLLSVIRILLVPVFVYLYIKGYRAYAIGVFITAGLTDVIDGYIARKYNCTSDLGKYLIRLRINCCSSRHFCAFISQSSFQCGCRLRIFQRNF